MVVVKDLTLEMFQGGVLADISGPTDDIPRDVTSEREVSDLTGVDSNDIVNQAELKKDFLDFLKQRQADVKDCHPFHTYLLANCILSVTELCRQALDDVEFNKIRPFLDDGKQDEFKEAVIAKVAPQPNAVVVGDARGVFARVTIELVARFINAIFAFFFPERE